MKLPLLLFCVALSPYLSAHAWTATGTTRGSVYHWRQILRGNSRSRHQTHLFQEELSSGRILSPEYFKSVYDKDRSRGNTLSERTSSSSATGVDCDDGECAGCITPWDIGGGRPQPAIVKAYEEGQLRGRIIDAGCGAGENCIYLAGKYGITSVFGCDLAKGGIKIANARVSKIAKIQEGNDNTMDVSDVNDSVSPFWTSPQFFVASCTEMTDEYFTLFGNKSELFDVSIDSGLLHCLSDDDAKDYVKQLKRILKPGTGRAYVGCFSTKNPAESWDNPRRLSPQYLENLFCQEDGWEITSIQDTWWARPPERGSSQGAFSMALWMEARLIS